MNRALHRRSDPLNMVFSKSQRIIANDRGFFYKVRGGKVNGPFKSRQDAESDLSVFIKILKIEAELDPNNFHIVS